MKKLDEEVLSFYMFNSLSDICIDCCILVFILLKVLTPDDLDTCFASWCFTMIGISSPDYEQVSLKIAAVTLSCHETDLALL